VRTAPAAPPTRKPAPPAGLAPHRTCIGCRRVSPQRALLRLVRTPEGFVEPDPRRKLGGRGAYLCPSEGCLTDAVRRGRWAHAFRAPAVLPPEAVEQLRALIRAGLVAGVRVTESCEVPIKGGC
jgi:uncharacterized protein